MDRRLHPLHFDFLHDCSDDLSRTCLCSALCHMNRIHSLQVSFAHRSQDLPIGDPRRSVRYAASTCLPWRSSSQWLLGSSGAAWLTLVISSRSSVPSAVSSCLPLCIYLFSVRWSLLEGVPRWEWLALFARISADSWSQCSCVSCRAA